MFPESKKEPRLSAECNSALLIQKYREAVLLDKQGMPGASHLRRQLFVAIMRRVNKGDDFINTFLSAHE